MLDVVGSVAMLHRYYTKVFYAFCVSNPLIPINSLVLGIR